MKDHRLDLSDRQTRSLPKYPHRIQRAPLLHQPIDGGALFLALLPPIGGRAAEQSRVGVGGIEIRRRVGEEQILC